MVVQVIRELLHAVDGHWPHEKHGFEVMWIGIAGVDRPNGAGGMALRNVGTAKKLWWIMTL